jgi:hypothetical protein
VPSTQLSVNPARIEMPLFAEGMSVLIHGASTATPFTFSTESEWSAGVSLEGGLLLHNLSGAAGVADWVGDADVRRFDRGRWSRVGFDHARVADRHRITAFPGSGNEQTLAIGAVNGANALLTIRSDGTFRLEGSLASNLALSGLPIQALQAGATLTVTESSLTLTGTVSGGSLDGVNTGSATATLVITPDHDRLERNGHRAAHPTRQLPDLGAGRRQSGGRA